MAESAVVDQEAAASAAAQTGKETPAPVAPAQDDTTLLGSEGDKPVVKEEAKEPTAEEKAAKETQLAADKKLMETEDKDLKPEELAKKQELIKAKQEADSKVVPEKYEFKVPEGMTLDTALVDKLTPVLKELGISQSAAQKLMDAYAPHIAEQFKAQQKSLDDGWNKIKSDWKNETTKLLGAEPAKELAHAAKFINKFGTPELRQMLNDTGVGNHPEMVKIMIAAGKAISEDAMPSGKKTSGNPEAGIDPAKFYSHPTSPK